MTRSESSMSDVESARYWLSWLEFGSKLAIILVVIGVGYEFVEKRFGAPLHQVIDDFKDAQIAKSNRIAAEANLEVARLTLEIEKMKAPRTLTPEQREIIVRAMNAYSGQGFAIKAAPDPEARELAKAIAMALISARWQAGHPLSAIQAGDIPMARGPVRGVEVEWQASSSQTTKEIGAALAKVLEEQGLATSSGPNPQSLLYPNALGITVGTKPQ
jgi:hypothetical protein